MSHTLNLGWTHALPFHAPTVPQWITSMERTVGQVMHRLTDEHHPAHPVYETHFDFIEDALMAREMYRL
ncbi:MULTISPECIES: hypothetical protein [unclassified Mycobacterium]|uniref:hypothetical protein n=1 Tax=unclassified Mycobacterium TaxID=2642494 RepID=UPI00048C8197|nr:MULTISPECIES: hypothetical protein [unclassified Mycobacterium]SEB05496.1 hypothetical protein SAMN04488580_106280 [Mycobacterium sp. 283mftsu]